MHARRYDDDAEIEIELVPLSIRTSSGHRVLLLSPPELPTKGVRREEEGLSPTPFPRFCFLFLLFTIKKHKKQKSQRQRQRQSAKPSCGVSVELLHHYHPALWLSVSAFQQFNLKAKKKHRKGQITIAHKRRLTKWQLFLAFVYCVGSVCAIIGAADFL